MDSRNAVADLFLGRSSMGKPVQYGTPFAGGGTLGGDHARALLAKWRPLDGERLRCSLQTATAGFDLEEKIAVAAALARD